MNSPQTAISALIDGDLIIMPTETVYGLGGRADDAVIVAKIFEAKGRPRFNPLIVHVSDVELAAEIGHFDARAHALAKAFWPGPLTIIVPIKNTSMVCDLARAGLDSVALRVPSHPLALEVLRGFKGGVVAPSANRSGRPSPTNFADAVCETGKSARVLLDGGACQIGLESSVVSLIGEARYLRPGAILREDISSIIGPLATDAAQGHRSPGRLSAHYAPDAPVTINVVTPIEGCVYLAFGPCDYAGQVFQLSETMDLVQAASNLFAFLRAADRVKPDMICVAPIPDYGLGEAINDRLLRATGFVG